MTGDSNNNSNAANRRMFFTMLWGAMFRRRSRAVMAVLASLVGAATLFCLTVVCLEVPRQMSEEFRSYGANLVVSSTEVSGTASAGTASSSAASSSAASSSAASDAPGMDSATLDEVIAAVDAAGQENHAEYRYENVRVHAASYIIAGMNPADTRVLDQHWTVEGDWHAAGDTKNIMVGRDIADAMNLQVGSSLTMSYRGDADDDSGSASQASDSASASASSSAASHASSDIMDTGGESFRVCGIIDTGGEEDSMIYADMALVEQLSGTQRGADAVEFASSLDADGLDALVSSINAHSAQWHVTAQKVSRISAANQRIITMLNTLF